MNNIRLLEAKGLHKVYYNGNKQLEVLQGVNLSIDKGKFVAIVGPSGAGKSTLLHILGGLDMPTQGEVIFGGKNIYNLSDIELSKIRNERIGFVFQFYHLLSEFTVLENVSLAWDMERRGFKGFFLAPQTSSHNNFHVKIYKFALQK